VTTLLISIFVLGYAAIAFEHNIKINKAASALITGVLSWTVYIISAENKETVDAELVHHLGDLSGILFFLLGAMTVVELIDAHNGFEIITSRIRRQNKTGLLWMVSLIAFFLSAVLDNLTTTIVMVSMMRKLVKQPQDRFFFAGMIVIAANAGGAWSPIGDVTTTMLWIGGQISPAPLLLSTFLPSAVSLLVPLLFASRLVRGKVEEPTANAGLPTILSERHQRIVLFSGIGILLAVPVFKMTIHLPPYMGMLLGLGLLWVITEIIHGAKDDEDKDALSVAGALQKIDAPSILFFLGILVAIAALESTHVLSALSASLAANIHSDNAIVIIIGLLSSIVDNVPLVAAVQGMYSLQQYIPDHSFWHFLAYCSGTGGSILIIGSAAGVAAMGLEKISFGWYLRKISWLALLGYLAGAGVYLVQAGLGS
jgi:Na+/H+ antiporter NhaD/arsenite permease-like protein